jgi:hypothetical protein
MATRSFIGKLESDGTIRAVYCHWDGYLEHNGKLLAENYRTDEKIDRLLNEGALSSLGRDIGTKHSFDELQHQSHCTFYSRDRGEGIEETKAEVFRNEQDFFVGAKSNWAEFVYLWKDQKWWYKQTYTEADWSELKTEDVNGIPVFVHEPEVLEEKCITA